MEITSGNNIVFVGLIQESDKNETWQAVAVVSD